MPSAKILDAKKVAVAELSEKVKASSSGVLVNYFKTSVEDDTKLRSELRAASVEYSVVKNTALRFVFNNAGYSELNSKLEGMTALAICKDDAVAPAKILSKFGETHKDFEIKAGFVDGKVITASEVNALAKLPAKEVLVAQVLCALNSPITGLVTVLNANIRGLACVLSAIAEKKEA